MEELKHHTKNYFEGKKNIKYQNETLNKICYRTYDYTYPYTTYTSDLMGNLQTVRSSSQKLHVIFI
ncbi:MAG: hypothetical protein D8M18_03290 [Bacteroidetes bacterium]|nr:hypothetical protein [Bacteroidota bacterium]GIK69254.1 MAG: hypothetical protein BroJett020_05490 [Bacteroidota bacterium]